MGAPTFKDCIAADIGGVFFQSTEFSEKHTVNGAEMDVIVDENELTERDAARGGVHTDGTFKARRLIYVPKAQFGRKPAMGALLTLDSKQYRVADCIDEDGIYSIELEGTRT